MSIHEMLGSRSRSRGRGVSRARSDRVIKAKAMVVLASLAAAGMSNATHTVAPGETLSKIAKRYGSSTAQIARANGITRPNLIRAGAKLILPLPEGAPPPSRPGANGLPPKTTGALSYTIVPGDSLARIAKKFGSSVKAIAEANGITRPNLIRIGQSLKVPVAAPPTVETMLQNYAARYGVDANFVKAIAWEESGWKQSVVSKAGAIGVMQVMPETGVFISKNLLKAPLDINDTEQNVMAGVRFLAFLLSRTGGDEATAAAGYFQGLRSVRTRGINPSTKAYVDDVMALKGRFAAR